ncbi:MAG: 4Fe-4S binding protein [Coriobacteriia bacterium]|nr:4Fe-4S binding protein [Coriobacteriia bacterium]
MPEQTSSAALPAFTLAIASGKGGTGKTLLATNISALCADVGERVALVDCDAEAPNDHLFGRYEGPRSTRVDSLFASVDTDACSACGLCRDACAYGAVRVLGSSALVFEELCHGCGLCVDICPENAITEMPKRIGEVSVRRSADFARLTLLTGTLDVGQVKTPAVIRAARDAAASVPADLIVLDAPPGVACAAVAAVRGADALLLVTEPTAFGRHDLRLGLELGRSLRLPMAVVVNRAGTGGDGIDELCDEFGVPVIARIPFDRRIAEVYARGGLAAAEMPDVRQALSGILDEMRKIATRESVRR